MPTHRRSSLARVLLLTTASAVLPGTAHLVSGHRRAGLWIAATAGAIVGGLLGIVLTSSRHQLLAVAVQPGWLTGIAVAAGVLAIAWVAVVLSSYAVLYDDHPRSFSVAQRTGAAAVLVVLCAAVVTPPLMAARYAHLQRNLITSVFPDTGVGIAADEVGDGADVWAGRDRLNILLIASDAGSDRTGTRTDSLVLVSVGVHSGDVAMFSLPRNLQRVPMPAGPLRHAWPNRFPDLLNEIYQSVLDKPGLLAGAADRGAAALKQVVGGILGLHVDYYALANMQGFEEFINALGGVTLTVHKRLPIGGYLADGTRVPPIDYIEPGRQKLNGYKAIWFARSRWNSNDYDRMSRQRCLLGALARQANPLTVLRKFQTLASTAKRLASTDIPRKLLPALVELAQNISATATIRSVTFVPPQIHTANPNYALIRATVRNTLAAPAPTPTPTAGRTAAAPPPPPTTRARATPQRSTPTPQLVDQVCA